MGKLRIKPAGRIAVIRKPVLVIDGEPLTRGGRVVTRAVVETDWEARNLAPSLSKVGV